MIPIAINRCLLTLEYNMELIPNQYVLEAHFLDKLNRVRRKEHVGVYKNLQTVEEVKEKWQKLKEFDEKYKITFKIYTNYDPFCA